MKKAKCYYTVCALRHDILPNASRAGTALENIFAIYGVPFSKRLLTLSNPLKAKDVYAEFYSRLATVS